MPQAKQGDRAGLGGERQQGREVGGLEEGHPAQAQSLGAGGESEVLDGAGDRGEIHFR